MVISFFKICLAPFYYLIIIAQSMMSGQKPVLNIRIPTGENFISCST